MYTTDLDITLGDRIGAPCNDASLSLYGPGEALEWHEHPASYVCVVMAGSFLESSHKSREERRVGDIVLHPAGQRHADCFGPYGAHCLNLRVAGIARPAVRRASAAFRVVAQTLAAQAALGSFGDNLVAECARAELVGEIRGNLRGKADRRLARARDPVDRVAEALDDQPERSWTLAELAGLAERHPTHLVRAFRMATGMTIGEYRRRRRFVSLCLGLRRRSESLGELALAHGYADQAHMTREFRRFAGCSPGVWRRHFC